MSFPSVFETMFETDRKTIRASLGLLPIGGQHRFPKPVEFPRVGELQDIEMFVSGADLRRGNRQCPEEGQYPPMVRDESVAVIVAACGARNAPIHRDEIEDIQCVHG
jgi:hypothetical protein